MNNKPCIGHFWQKNECEALCAHPYINCVDAPVLVDIQAVYTLHSFKLLQLLSFLTTLSEILKLRMTAKEINNIGSV